MVAASDFCGGNDSSMGNWTAAFYQGMRRGGTLSDAKDDQIIDARIIDTAKKNLPDGSKTQQYLIEVEHEQFRARVWHRYSDFRQLHKRLAERYGEGMVPAIPGKQYYKFSERVIVHRMEKLNSFLQGML
jgi:hypothetical protein